jgi:hypothetical protein
MSTNFSDLTVASRIGCPWNSNFTWDAHVVTSTALHNLTFICPYGVNRTYSDFEKKLEDPATFFVQVSRLILSLLLFLLVSVVYNSVTVLGRTVLSVAMCSLYWIIMFLLLTTKAMVFVVLVPTVPNTDSPKDAAQINEAGFVCLVVLQCLADLMLLFALDHEQRFRSSDYATLNSHPYSNTCIPITFRRVMCSWYRLPAIASVLVPLVLLAAVEIVLKTSSHDRMEEQAPAALVWTFIVSLYLPRLYAVGLIVRLFLLKDSLRPTVLAKVFLVAGFLFSLVDHLPSSVTTVAPYADHHIAPSNKHCDDPCELSIMTVFDLFQLLGGMSVIFYTLFVRSQYLRIENECKLAIVWDMQSLLNVNGRSQDVDTL